MFGKLEEYFAKGSGHTVEDLDVCLTRMGRLDVVYEGWMWKRGKVVQNWKRRYFMMVSPGFLVYAEDDKNVEKLKNIKVRSELPLLSSPSSRARARTRSLARADRATRGAQVVHGRVSHPRDIRKAAELAQSLGVLGTVRVTKETKVEKLGRFEERDHVFSIKAPEPVNRVFFFACDSAQDVDKWEEQIRAMDNFEERQKEAEEQQELKAEEERRERIKDKYRALLPRCKDAFKGGRVICGQEVWLFTSGGPGEEKPDVLEMIEGRHKGQRYLWNGTVVSDGQVALMGDDKGGWGLWNGKRMEWRTPACLDRRGRGQAWEYRADAEWKLWTANEFTRRMNFPRSWEFVSDTLLRSNDHQMYNDIPKEVVIEGSVPPMLAIACGMYCASRKESIYQVKILREIQAEKREKRILKEAMKDAKVNP